VGLIGDLRWWILLADAQPIDFSDTLQLSFAANSANGSWLFGVKRPRAIQPPA
jgi:hypothetical protein